MKNLFFQSKQFFFTRWMVDNLLLRLNKIGHFFLFYKQAFVWGFRKPYRGKLLIDSLEFVGNQSILIILLTSIFTGMALAYQIYLGFIKFNAASLVGPIVAIGIARELGPVLTGLIIAARAGGAMAAQLGSMRVTEQIDALDVMGIRSVKYLATPRIFAAAIATPVLCAIFVLIAIMGAYFVIAHLVGLDSAVFWSKIAQFFKMSDIYEGLFKSFVFGIIFSSICTYTGYFTKGGAKGVGNSTNKAIVYSMVSIIVVDFFLSNLVKLVKG